MKVLFFASLREQLDCSALELVVAAPMTVAELKQRIGGVKGEQWQAVLNAGNVICAVNYTVADENAVVQPGDEVAFYPPVTGG